MKTQELRQMTAKKLIDQLRKTRRDLTSVKFRAKTGQNQNTAQITKLRKMIAKIMTILNEMKLNLETSKK
jgi:large subunit ribosomal protein L29